VSGKTFQFTKKIILFAAVGGLALVASALALPCWGQEDVGEGIARGVIEGLGDGRRGDHDRNRHHEDDRDCDLRLSVLEELIVRDPRLMPCWAYIRSSGDFLWQRRLFRCP
jgi:hypothetical protein